MRMFEQMFGGGGGMFSDFQFGGSGGPDVMFGDDMHGGAYPFGEMGGMGGVSNARRQKQDPTVQHDLPVTLEDICKGCTKKMKITRKIVGTDGATRTEDKVLTINIKPGWKSGTKITFPKEGDQLPGRIPADIAFVIKDKPHQHFKREGSDIRYCLKISLRDALCGFTTKIPTLDGTSRPYKAAKIVKPGYKEKILGEGLPNPKNGGRRGDLLVDFEIRFPDTLSTDAKLMIQNALPAS